MLLHVEKVTFRLYLSILINNTVVLLKNYKITRKYVGSIIFLSQKNYFSKINTIWINILIPPNNFIYLYFLVQKHLKTIVNLEWLIHERIYRYI